MAFCFSTYQFGFHFVEAFESLLGPLNLRRVPALPHTRLQFFHDFTHAIFLTTATGRDGTKGGLGTSATKACAAVDAAKFTVRPL